ncbi:helix-turn-helix domain-containing protein [Rhizobium sp. BK661]|uniref:helix-turn-helix domain-containing protein n=1 Tax=Rhizobium sp. BK661 TaxID=2586991 RepID=UPI0021680708|nr:helix-turn-helix transcriptional regulator [Rhizobium sp. BK661]
MPRPKSAQAVDLEVGRKIRERRRALGMSQFSLAEIVGIASKQIQKYEQGVSQIGSGRLSEIAAALNVPISYFFPEPSTRRDFNGIEFVSGINSKEGMELNIAFSKIPSQKTRSAIIELLRAYIVRSTPRPVARHMSDRVNANVPRATVNVPDGVEPGEQNAGAQRQ